jgi:hypothetical protein
MSGDRTINFTIPGSTGVPGVNVKIVEDEGRLIFTVDVLDCFSNLLIQPNLQA